MTRNQIISTLYKAEEALNEMLGGDFTMTDVDVERLTEDVEGALVRVENILRVIERDE